MIREVAQNANGSARSYDPWLVIGVVENFKLPAILVERPAAATASTAEHLSVEASPVGGSPVERPAVVEGEALRETLPKATEKHPEAAAIYTEEIAAEPHAVRGSRARVTRFASLWFRGLRLRVRSLRFPLPKWPSFAWPRLRRPEFEWSKGVISGVATVAGLIVLCIGSVIAWHRMDVIAGSEAHTQPHRPQIGSTVPATTPAFRGAYVENASAVRAETKTASLGQFAVSPLNTSGTARDVVKPASTIAAIAPMAKRPARVQEAASTPKLPAEMSDIQATRPPLRSVYPDYSGVEARGVVVLVAEVDSDGTVRSVRVVRGNHALATVAVRAVRQWRYRPYVKDGRTVATETNIVISVFSDDAISMSFPPNIPVAR
jgi:TonB family protein